MDLGVGGIEQAVSTGSLPQPDRLQVLLEKAHARSKDDDSGTVAHYIPALADADPNLFGISIAALDGQLHSVGDAEHLFSIQSISKAFVYALVCQEIGHGRVLDIVGVDNTGLAFNSVMAIELQGGHPRNPMVNGGAMATTALVPGDSELAMWEFIVDGLSRFAGRPLRLDVDVYESEMATNQRNVAIARLLQSYGRIEREPSEVVDVYTRQCSLLVNANDLAVMGATLAGGGVNPLTGEQVVDAGVCSDTLAVLASCGMYEHSGEWLFEIGVPAKSGVAGGIVTIAPGKGGLGLFSPPLDDAGNSVRGQQVAAYLSRTLGLNVFASSPIDR